MYEFEIQGKYGRRWELETTEDTRNEAMKRLREYRENMPEYLHRCRIVKKQKAQGK